MLRLLDNHLDVWVRQGACGYGGLDKAQWPYWSVAALSVRNPFYINGVTKGCGCVPSLASSVSVITRASAERPGRQTEYLVLGPF